MQKFEDQMKRIYKKYLIEPQSEKPESGTWKGRFCPGCGLPMVNADEHDV